MAITFYLPYGPTALFPGSSLLPSSLWSLRSLNTEGGLGGLGKAFEKRPLRRPSIVHRPLQASSLQFKKQFNLASKMPFQGPIPSVLGASWEPPGSPQKQGFSRTVCIIQQLCIYIMLLCGSSLAWAKFCGYVYSWHCILYSLSRPMKHIFFCFFFFSTRVPLLPVGGHNECLATIAALR